MSFYAIVGREAPFPTACPATHFVSSTVTPTLLGLIAGDHLVRSKSAAGLGKSRRIPFEPEAWTDADRVESLRLAQSPTGVREAARLAGSLTGSVGRRQRYGQRRSAATASVLASIAAR